MKKYLLAGLATLCLFISRKDLSFQELQNNVKEVGWARIEYNEGPLRSEFTHCSAVILDYGESATMAHAHFPTDRKKNKLIKIIKRLIEKEIIQI